MTSGTRMYSRFSLLVALLALPSQALLAQTGQKFKLTCSGSQLTVIMRPDGSLLSTSTEKVTRTLNLDLERRKFCYETCFRMEDIKSVAADLVVLTLLSEKDASGSTKLAVRDAYDPVNGGYSSRVVNNGNRLVEFSGACTKGPYTGR